MSEKDALSAYRSKRNLDASGEPSGGTTSGQPRFVVQRHEASTTHYDFRLEVDGVLKSWAVPKGPSPDPQEKRLASPTEDHPLDYADFEGTIPEGSYGAGTVVVWDIGTYRNLTSRRRGEVAMPEALESGHVKIQLDGHKLHGAYALTRSRMRDKEQWLLVKVNDEEADPKDDPVGSRPESVLSGRTNDELAEKDRS